MLKTRSVGNADPSVEVLHSLARRAFDQVVDDRHDDQRATRGDAPHSDAVRSDNVVQSGQPLV